MPSAGILSPADNKTISPTTTSSTFISSTFPFLFTLHFILAASFCNLTKDFSLPYSEIVDIKEATKIAITIPTVSYQSKSCIRKRILMPKAINKIRIIGSPKLSKNLLKKVVPFASVISFVPFSLRLFSTSSSVSPNCNVFLFIFLLTLYKNCYKREFVFFTFLYRFSPLLDFLSYTLNILREFISRNKFYRQKQCFHNTIKRKNQFFYF